MAISPIQSTILVPVTSPPVPTAKGEIASAVKTLNDTGTAGAGREFSIAIDAKAKVPVVRIVDSNTREIIEQIPSQYILDLAQQITQETSSNSGSSSR
jgi:uncharacterized FlaG/YvyC family protein